jgi:hypothetical protein
VLALRLQAVGILAAVISGLRMAAARGHTTMSGLCALQGRLGDNADIPGHRSTPLAFLTYAGRGYDSYVTSSAPAQRTKLAATFFAFTVTLPPLLRAGVTPWPPGGSCPHSPPSPRSCGRVTPSAHHGSVAKRRPGLSRSRVFPRTGP